jgi:formate dehydrogenase subunit gamma
MELQPRRAPQAFATERPPDAIRRYSEAERLTHWAVALLYLWLFFSGLALFHPYFFWISALFGSPTMMRILHPFFGVALAVLFFAYASRLWRDNLILASDRRWLRGMIAYMNGKDETPVEGKYNAGQKLMYWSMIACVAALLLSGLVLWRPYLAPSFGLPARRAAALIHAVVAFVMFVGIGVHVYAALWTRGSMRAMTRGWVTRTWARYHHPGWYEKTVGKDAP